MIVIVFIKFIGYYKHDRRLFLLWFQMIYDKNATIVEVKIGHPERKYDCGEVTIISNKPSLTEVREVTTSLVQTVLLAFKIHTVCEHISFDLELLYVYKSWPYCAIFPLKWGRVGAKYFAVEKVIGIVLASPSPSLTVSSVKCLLSMYIL